MPTPPASCTALLLSIRAFEPRLQSTILPVTFAGPSVPEKHSSTWVALAPPRPASTESISGEDGTAAPRPTPVYEAPLPRVTVVLYAWSKVPAATVVSHGIALSTVDAPGPALPAAAETNTPEAAALRNESSSRPNWSTLSPTEKLITSTPSLMASLIAAMMSAVLPEAVVLARFS